MANRRSGLSDYSLDTTWVQVRLIDVGRRKHHAEGAGVVIVANLFVLLLTGKVLG